MIFHLSLKKVIHCDSLHTCKICCHGDLDVQLHLHEGSVVLLLLKHNQTRICKYMYNSTRTMNHEFNPGQNPNLALNYETLSMGDNLITSQQI